MLQPCSPNLRPVFLKYRDFLRKANGGPTVPPVGGGSANVAGVGGGSGAGQVGTARAPAQSSKMYDYISAAQYGSTSVANRVGWEPTSGGGYRRLKSMRMVAAAAPSLSSEETEGKAALSTSGGWSAYADLYSVKDPQLASELTNKDKFDINSPREEDFEHAESELHELLAAHHTGADADNPENPKLADMHHQLANKKLEDKLSGLSGDERFNALHEHVSNLQDISQDSNPYIQRVLGPRLHEHENELDNLYRKHGEAYEAKTQAAVQAAQALSDAHDEEQEALEAAHTEAKKTVAATKEEIRVGDKARSAAVEKEDADVAAAKKRVLQVQLVLDSENSRLRDSSLHQDLMDKKDDLVSQQAEVKQKLRQNVSASDDVPAMRRRDKLQARKKKLDSSVASVTKELDEQTSDRTKLEAQLKEAQKGKVVSADGTMSLDTATIAQEAALRAFDDSPDGKKLADAKASVKTHNGAALEAKRAIAAHKKNAPPSIDDVLSGVGGPLGAPRHQLEREARESVKPKTSIEQAQLSDHTTRASTLVDNIKSHLDNDASLSSAQKAQLNRIIDGIDSGGHADLSVIPSKEHVSELRQLSKLAGKHGKSPFAEDAPAAAAPSAASRRAAFSSAMRVGEQFGAAIASPEGGARALGVVAGAAARKFHSLLDSDSKQDKDAEAQAPGTEQEDTAQVTPTGAPTPPAPAASGVPDSSTSTQPLLEPADTKPDAASAAAAPAASQAAAPADAAAAPAAPDASAAPDAAAAPAASPTAAKPTAAKPTAAKPTAAKPTAAAADETHKLADGGTHVGERNAKGQPHGPGKKTDADGTVAEGKFENGKLHGEGKLTATDGTYEGKFENGKLREGTITATEGTVYEGKFENAKLHGEGTITTTDGTVHEGEFKNGWLQGEGTITTKAGDVHEGAFEHGKLHGEGKRTYLNGEVYEGEFKRGSLHGQGKITHPDGEVHEGKFENDKLHGQGTITDAKGTVTMEGTFEEGKLHGQGKLTDPTEGTLYEGKFEEGKLHGEGKVTTAYVVSEGDFKDGKLHGQGKETYLAGHVYEGAFENGKLHGEGKRTMDYGTVEEGKFENGYLHGKEGKITSSKGIVVEEGEFKDGKLHGEGKLTDPEGDVHEGAFEEGKLHGQGKITHTNGTLYEGAFEEGKLHGDGKVTSSKGAVREGKFKEGDLHGKGKVTSSKGHVYEGKFENGKLREGKLTDPAGDVHEGKFENGKLHGEGKRTTTDGVSEGKFENGKLHGEGKVTHTNGTLYEGKFEEGNFHGQGKLTTTEGTLYEGKFENGNFQGKHKVTFKDGIEGTFDFEDRRFEPTPTGERSAPDAAAAKTKAPDNKASKPAALTDDQTKGLHQRYRDHLSSDKSKAEQHTYLTSGKGGKSSYHHVHAHVVRNHWYVSEHSGYHGDESPTSKTESTPYATKTAAKKRVSEIVKQKKDKEGYTRVNKELAQHHVSAKLTVQSHTQKELDAGVHTKQYKEAVSKLGDTFSTSREKRGIISGDVLHHKKHAGSTLQYHAIPSGSGKNRRYKVVGENKHGKGTTFRGKYKEGYYPTAEKAKRAVFRLTEDKRWHDQSTMWGDTKIKGTQQQAAKKKVGFMRASDAVREAHAKAISSSKDRIFAESHTRKDDSGNPAFYYVSVVHVPNDPSGDYAAVIHHGAHNKAGRVEASHFNTKQEALDAAHVKVAVKTKGEKGKKGKYVASPKDPFTHHKTVSKAQSLYLDSSQLPHRNHHVFVY